MPSRIATSAGPCDSPAVSHLNIARILSRTSASPAPQGPHPRCASLMSGRRSRSPRENVTARAENVTARAENVTARAENVTARGLEGRVPVADVLAPEKADQRAEEHERTERIALTVGRTEDRQEAAADPAQEKACV